LNLESIEKVNKTSILQLIIYSFVLILPGLTLEYLVNIHNLFEVNIINLILLSLLLSTPIHVLGRFIAIIFKFVKNYSLKTAELNKKIIEYNNLYTDTNHIFSGIYKNLISLGKYTPLSSFQIDNHEFYSKEYNEYMRIHTYLVFISNTLGFVFIYFLKHVINLPNLLLILLFGLIYFVIFFIFYFLYWITVKFAKKIGVLIDFAFKITNIIL